MNNPPAQLFPTWYRRVDLSCDVATVDKRLAALKTLVIQIGPALWVPILKIYLGVEVPQQDWSKIEAYFIKEDPFFPVENNQQLLRVLAAAVLCTRFSEHKTITTYYTSLAIITSAFFNQFSLDDLPPVYKYATEALKVSSQEQRKTKVVNTASLSELPDKLNNIVDAEEYATEENVLELTKATLALLGTVKEMNEWNKSVSEELDSLWWLYGEVSSSGKARFDKLGTAKMIIFGALDLFKITKENVGLLKAKDFLGKALFVSSKKPVKEDFSVFEVVNALSKDEKMIFNDHYSEENRSLTPVLTALVVSQQINIGEDWEPLFRNKLPATDLSKKFNAFDICMQLYNELMLQCHL